MPLPNLENKPVKMCREPCGAGPPSPVAAAPGKADPRPPPSLLQEPGVKPDPVQTPEQHGPPRASPQATALPGESSGGLQGLCEGLAWESLPALIPTTATRRTSQTLSHAE